MHLVVAHMSTSLKFNVPTNGQHHITFLKKGKKLNGQLHITCKHGLIVKIKGLLFKISYVPCKRINTLPLLLYKQKNLWLNEK